MPCGLEPRAVAGLAHGGWRRLTFDPFRAGVEICRLVAGTPEVALLRYAPGAAVPRHRHTALEAILVLDGVQTDERGSYGAGTLVLNPPGSEHRVWSDGGCIVLITWAGPVEILDDDARG